MTTEIAWNQFAEGLRRYFQRRIADRHAAEDLVQESFLRIHRGLASLADDQRLASWVYRIAQNVLNDYLRRRQRQPVMEERTGEPVPREGSNEPEGERIVAACIASMIDELPDADREVLELIEMRGYTQPQVGEHLGLSTPGAKSRIQRARARLKQAFDDCCAIEFDRRGAPLDCHKHDGECAA